MMLLRRKGWLGLVLMALCAPAWALNIVATIPPMGALALPFVSDEDEITVILSAGQTPHGFQMRPSHRFQLEQADIILAVGSGVDGWADKVLKSMPEKVIWMQNLPGLVKIDQRNDAKWPKHHHDEKHEHEHEHEAEHEHKHSESLVNDAKTLTGKPDFKQDPHIWLSPVNGRLMAQAIAQKLSQTTPKRTAEIEQSLKIWLADLQAVEAQTRQDLQSVKAQPFIVLHDAFQYYEKHFGLNGVGAIQINPELKPSLQKVLTLREQIQQQGVVCVFKEPQFPEKQVAYVVQDLAVNIGQLDPLGRQARLQPYLTLLQNLSDSFKRCLATKVVAEQY